MTQTRPEPKVIIRTDCALLLILRWRNAPLIWTNFSI